MLRLVLATLWRRRAQSALLVVLAAVAATGAATAPGYVAASLQSLAAASVVDAAAGERVVEATNEEPIGDTLDRDLTTFAQRVGRELDLTGFTSVSGAAMVAVLANELHQIAYRDDVCAHLAIDGACPRGPREVLLAEPFAARLGLAVGDTVALRGRTEIPPVPMTVVGRYRALNADDPYWGIQTQGSERLADVGIFTPLATFASLRPNQIELSVDLTATPAAYRDRDPQAMTLAAEQGALRLGAEGIHVSSGLRALADRLGEERRLVVNGVVIGVTELLVVCWLALFLAVRRTAETRRADIGLLKLRGARRRDLWRFVAGQSLLPLAVGGLVGYALGPAGRGMAGRSGRRWPVGAGLGRPSDPDGGRGRAGRGRRRDRRARGRTAHADRVGGRPRPGVGRPRTGRRQLVLDAIVVVLALAGAYQAVAGAGQGVRARRAAAAGAGRGVLAVRLVPVAAGRLGANALRAGRLGAALAAHHLARRAGAASVLGVGSWSSRSLTATTLTGPAPASARADGPHSRSARRGCSPSGCGQPAPAAAGGADRRSRRPVGHGGGTHGYRGRHPCSRSTPRDWRRSRPGWTPTGCPTSPRWRPPCTRPGYEPITVRADSLTVDASSTVEGRGLVAGLVAADGRPLEVSFGPLATGRRTYAQPVACVTGCRLASLSVVSTASTVDITGAVTVHSVSTVDGALADRTRWRAGLGRRRRGTGADGRTRDGLRIAPGRGPAVAASCTALRGRRAHSPAGGARRRHRRGPVATPLGRRRRRRAPGTGGRAPERGCRAPPTGCWPTSSTPTGSARTPVTGRPPRCGWAGTRPPASTPPLTSAGLTLLGERGIAGRQSELDARGPATALRFLVIVALVAIAMALLSFAVAAAAERRPRGVELAALRRQGLPARVVRRVGLGGYPALGTGRGRAGPGRRDAPGRADAGPAAGLRRRVRRAGAAPGAGAAVGAAAALACLAGFAVVGLAAGAGLAVAARPARSGVGMVGLMLALLRAQWAQVADGVRAGRAGGRGGGRGTGLCGHGRARGRGRRRDGGPAVPAHDRRVRLRAGQGRSPATTPRRSCWTLARRRDFEHVAPTTADHARLRHRARGRLPGLRHRHAPTSPSTRTATLDFRENFCDHVVIVAGRCVAAPGEVIVSAGRSLATQRDRVRGQRPVRQRRPGRARLLDPGRRAVPAGRGRGLPAAPTPTDPYWGATPTSAPPGAEPVYTDRRTRGHLRPRGGEPGGRGLPAARHVRRGPHRRHPVGRAGHHGAGPGPGQRQLRHREPAHHASSATGTRSALVPASAAVPLLALCWFVLFLAIAYTAQARRHELGIVKLRGVSTRDQWSLAAAESLTPVLAGAVAGYLLGHLGGLAVRAGGLRAARERGR